MSTSDLQDQATTEMASAPGAAVDAPAEPAAATGAPPTAPQPEPEWPPVAPVAAATPAPRSLRPSWVHVVAILGALLAGFLVYALLITGPLQARSQSHLINQFRTALRTQNSTALLTAPPNGAPVALIRIPQLNNLEQVVVQGISSTDTMLGPGRDPSTVLPGQAGNAAIVGRGTTYGAPFAHIGDLAVGDTIDVVTAQGPFVYVVSQVSNAFKLGSPAATAQTKGNHLTLISASSSFRPSKEWVVVAKLVGKGYQATGPLPLPPAGYQPGASTLTGAWGGILLWGELLFAAIVLTWVLYRRRFAPAVTYLLTTPVLIALAYLFYGALATLLPPAL